MHDPTGATALTGSGMASWGRIGRSSVAAVHPTYGLDVLARPRSRRSSRSYIRCTWRRRSTRRRVGRRARCSALVVAVTLESTAPEPPPRVRCSNRSSIETPRFRTKSGVSSSARIRASTADTTMYPIPRRIRWATWPSARARSRIQASRIFALAGRVAFGKPLTWRGRSEAVACGLSSGPARPAAPRAS